MDMDGPEGPDRLTIAPSRANDLIEGHFDFEGKMSDSSNKKIRSRVSHGGTKRRWETPELIESEMASTRTSFVVYGGADFGAYQTTAAS
ncbi:MAG: hypothetical protein VYB54_10690 [Pseudomonadota bacterium]|nr:hypothetical protein [Pseudomonadota bacterium]